MGSIDYISRTENPVTSKTTAAASFETTAIHHSKPILSMGIFSDLKRLLFGASSVAKSAANKGMEAGKSAAQQAGDTIGNNAEELFDSAKTTAGDLSTKAAEGAGEAWAKAKDLVEDLGDKVSENPVGKQLMDTAESVGHQVKEAAAPLVDKAADLSETVGKTVLEEGGKLTEKLGDVAESVGGTAMAAGGTLMGRLKNVADDLGAKGKDVFDDAQDAAADATAAAANTAGNMADRANAAADSMKASARAGVNDLQASATAATNDMGDVMDDITAKAEQLGADAQAKAGGMADKLSTSELAGKDDFFTKAERFAGGDYDMDGKIAGNTPATPAPGTLSVGENPDYVKPEPTGTIAGMEDLDGDGDELIDDAIIEKDDAFTKNEDDKLV